MATLTVGMDAGDVFVYVDRINGVYKLIIDDDNGTTLVVTGTYTQIRFVRDQIFAKLDEAKDDN